jgi:hypothetical protein
MPRIAELQFHFILFKFEMRFGNLHLKLFNPQRLLLAENIQNNVTCLSPLSKGIVRCLLYFDIFQYPLTAEEIHKYCCGFPATEDEIKLKLKVLETAGYISCKMSFYSVKNIEIANKVERRIKGNREAEKYLKIAARFTKFISSFPFVRGICLSGSLSKGYADSESDIDYFIITEPGRLWICRTLLVLFKKIFLFNSHKYFCVNYFIDKDNLAIPDKNIFTATEMLSIIPTYNAGLYSQLMKANPWVTNFYPNAPSENITQAILPVKERWVKRLLEKLFSGAIGNKLDDYFFRITLSTWKRKFKDFDKEQFDLSLRSRKNVSKHHPNSFQVKVLKKYANSVKNFEEKFGLSL